MTTLTRLLRLMTPFRWWIALTVLVCFGTLGASVGLMAMSAYLISKAALVTGFADLALTVTAVRAFAIARAALRYTERYLSHLVTFRILTRLRVWFYAAAEPLAPARLQEYRSGDLLTRLGADIETLDQFYIRAIAPPLAAALVTALSCAILGAFDLQLGLVLLAFLLMTGVGLPLVTRWLSQVPAAQRIAGRAQLNAALTDAVQGNADLLAFGAEQESYERVLRSSGDVERAQVRLAIVRGLSQALAALFAGLAGLTVLLLAIPLVSDGQLQGVYLALLPLTAIASFEAVQPLGAALQQREVSQVAARRLFSVVDAPPPVVEPALPLPLPTDYSIEFRGVSFRYAPDLPLALDDVSFRIPAGGRLVVAGRSGAGKSTLVNLLVRFWDVQGGQLLIGDVDVRGCCGDDVREIVGVVSQHTHLFNGTIRDNLLLAKGDATDEEIVAACRLAQVHDFIESLPAGYDTPVGENGMKLSGGERQQIAIARVMLKDAPILILDEATANLDALTERRVIQALEIFMRDRTTLIISHRPARFDHVDRVLALDHGRVVRGAELTSLARIARPRATAARKLADHTGSSLVSRQHPPQRDAG